MFPIKLTNHHFVNPEAILNIEYVPNGQAGRTDALLIITFENSAFNELCFRGAEAEEGFANWNAEYELSRREESTLDDFIKNNIGGAK